MVGAKLAALGLGPVVVQYGIQYTVYVVLRKVVAIDIMTSQGMYSIVVGGSWNKVFVQYCVVRYTR